MNPPSGLALPKRRITVKPNNCPCGCFLGHKKAYRAGGGRKYRWKRGYARKHEHTFIFGRWVIIVGPTYWTYRGGRVSSFWRVRGRIVL